MVLYELNETKYKRIHARNLMNVNFILVPGEIKLSEDHMSFSAQKYKLEK